MKTIQVILKIFLLLTLLTGYCFVTEPTGINVILSDYQGKVEILSEGSSVSVKKGMLLKEQYLIKVGKDSIATLLFQDGSNIVLRGVTEVELKQLISTNVSINLNKGKLKAKITPRQVSQVFEIKTPVSVASIRGTEFILSYENGISELIVVDGMVWFSDMFGNGAEVHTNEGCNVTENGLGEKFSSTEDKLKNLLKEFEEKFKAQIEELKNEFRSFIEETKIEKYYTLETVQQIKEADFETGRTLRDVHGNLTRVEQMISRNKDNIIEFVNITKRDTYSYKGYYKDYAKEIESNKPRIDILKVGIEFNQSLPEKISEWPKYIADKNKGGKLELYPQRVYCEVSNKKDSFLQEVTFNKETSDDKEKLVGELSISVSNGDKTYHIDTDYNEDVKGKLPDGKSKEEDDGKLWFWAEGPLPVKENINNDDKIDNKDILWLQTEGYIINNDGKILTPTDFTSSNVKDPFTLLKEIAFESIIFVRRVDDSGKLGENFFNRNLDLIVTPDIVVALVKQIAPSATNLEMKD